MRVFVTGTGRCGTTTFYYACTHITNYSVESETDHHDLEYPDGGIYIDPMLWSVLPTLIRKYPDSLFVHLQREKKACVESLAKLPAFGGGYVIDYHRPLWATCWPPNDRTRCAELFYDMVNGYLAAWAGKAHRNVVHVWLEDMTAGAFRRCWDAVGATGDYAAALAEWHREYNSGESEGHK